MASPISQTTPWSAMVAGLVTKKKARVMWKRQMEVKIVLADKSPMVTDGFAVAIQQSRLLDRMDEWYRAGLRAVKGRWMLNAGWCVW